MAIKTKAKAKKPTTIKDLTLDEKNVNRHSQLGTGLLKSSVKEEGFGRSILISDDNVVIAGNGTVQAAGSIGMEKVRIIETDGSEVIAVKRTDIKSGTAKFFKMALADNVVASKNIVLDVVATEALVEEYPEVKAWAAIVTDPPDKKVKEDEDASNTTTMTFHFSNTQAGNVKKALKISKGLNKSKAKTAGNTNDHANALYFIVAEFLKLHKGK